MHVAINASIVDDRPTGLGIYTLNVVRELARVRAPGDRLTVLTGCPAVFAGIDVEVVPISRFTQPRYGLAAGFYRAGWNLLALPAALRRGDYDVLYNVSHHGLLHAGAVPQVVTIQNDVEVSFRFPEQHRLQSVYFRRVIPRMLRASAAVVTTSATAREILLRHYRLDPARVHFAHNAHDARAFSAEPGADDAAVRAARRAEAPYLLLVGATYPHKNVAAALRAFVRVHAARPAVRFVIAGYRAPYLEPLLAELPTAARAAVVAHPYVPQPELAALYRGAHGLVFPSFHESFGIPAVEAMATGCPVVVARASALPEICGDAAVYVDPRDAADVERGMAAVLDDAALRATLRERGLARAPRFSWRETAETILGVLRAAADDGRRAEPRRAAPAPRGARPAGTLT
jgi:glycosyltransferase involved in cell wall biosynthesis